MIVTDIDRGLHALEDLRIGGNNGDLSALSLLSLTLLLFALGLHLVELTLASRHYVWILLLKHGLHHEVDLQIRIA